MGFGQRVLGTLIGLALAAGGATVYKNVSPMTYKVEIDPRIHTVSENVVKGKAPWLESRAWPWDDNFFERSDKELVKYQGIKVAIYDDDMDGAPDRYNADIPKSLLDKIYK